LIILGRTASSLHFLGVQTRAHGPREDLFEKWVENGTWSCGHCVESKCEQGGATREKKNRSREKRVKKTTTRETKIHAPKMYENTA
jgi:hypothetical protein